MYNNESYGFWDDTKFQDLLRKQDRDTFVKDSASIEAAKTPIRKRKSRKRSRDYPSRPGRQGGRASRGAHRFRHY